GSGATARRGPARGRARLARLRRSRRARAGGAVETAPLDETERRGRAAERGGGTQAPRTRGPTRAPCGYRRRTRAASRGSRTGSAQPRERGGGRSGVGPWRTRPARVKLGVGGDIRAVVAHTDLITLDGSTFWYTDPNGDVEARQHEGFFYEDVRHLSSWHV